MYTGEKNRMREREREKSQKNFKIKNLHTIDRMRNTTRALKNENRWLILNFYIFDKSQKRGIPKTFMNNNRGCPTIYRRQ